MLFLSAALAAPAWAATAAHSVQNSVQNSVMTQDTMSALDTAPAPGLTTVQDAAVPEPVSTGRAVRDEVIRSELQAVFDRVPTLRRVDVTVDAGVVRLEGIVLNGEARDRAAALAEGMDDVVFVDNRIRESTSLDEQLQPTWERLRELGYSTLAKLPLLLVAVLIVGLASTLGSLLAKWSGPKYLGTRNPFLQNLIRRFLQAALVLIGFVVALDLLDATALVGAVVGTAGLAGLAIGFAFKDIAENYLAGTILALRQPFSKNDEILVDAFQGKVVRLTPRETILMTADGNHVRLPNALIFRSPMINFTRNPLRQFQFDAGLGMHDDLVRARQVAVATLLDMEGVLKEPPPQALIMELGRSTVSVRFFAWTDQRVNETVRVRSEAIRLVKLALEGAGITMPSPEYSVQMPASPMYAEDALSPLRPPVHRHADVSVDRTVDKQIDAERRVSEEADLLDGANTGVAGGVASPSSRVRGTA